MAAPATRSSRRYRNIVANLRAQGRPCCLCGELIDYSLHYPHLRSFSAHHIKSFSAHPELREDPANLDAAHLECNKAGTGVTSRSPFTPSPLGQPSRDW